MRTLVATLAIACLAASGCGRVRDRDASPAPTPTPSTTVTSVPDGGYPVGLASKSLHTADGRDRTYHVFAPVRADTSMPLLVALHGGLGSGMQFRDNSGFDDLAEEHGFIVVYPDGIRIVENRDNRVWNGGGCCGPAAEGRRDVDDVSFIAAVIDDVRATYPIDDSRIYVTGHSNGAIMAYRLACELSATIAAIAFQSGSIEIDDCAPPQPVSVLHLHGLDDASIDIDGGTGDGVTNYAFSSPRASVEFMAASNGCTDSEPIVDPVNPDVSGTRWLGCAAETHVELVMVEHANHAWMGHTGSAVQAFVMGSPYADLDASAVIWDFLAEQRRS